MLRKVRDGACRSNAVVSSSSPASRGHGGADPTASITADPGVTAGVALAEATSLLYPPRRADPPMLPRARPGAATSMCHPREVHRGSRRSSRATFRCTSRSPGSSGPRSRRHPGPRRADRERGGVGRPAGGVPADRGQGDQRTRRGWSAGAAPRLGHRGQRVGDRSEYRVDQPVRGPGPQRAGSADDGAVGRTGQPRPRRRPAAGAAGAHGAGASAPAPLGRTHPGGGDGELAAGRLRRRHRGRARRRWALRGPRSAWAGAGHGPPADRGQGRRDRGRARCCRSGGVPR